MIKTIIFDFGDVFINLDKTRARQHAMHLYGVGAFSNASNTLKMDFDSLSEIVSSGCKAKVIRLRSK